ncbi:hypothetical protein O9929_12915 [Vibrio lentus]|nr:hypothetical protein [Vibrio lentus]
MIKLINIRSKPLLNLELNFTTIVRVRRSHIFKGAGECPCHYQLQRRPSIAINEINYHTTGFRCSSAGNKYLIAFTVLTLSVLILGHDCNLVVKPTRRLST